MNGGVEMDTIVDVFIALAALGTLGLSGAFAFTLVTLAGKARTAGAGVSGGGEIPSGSSAEDVEVWVPDDEDDEFEYDPTFDYEPWLLDD